MTDCAWSVAAANTRSLQAHQRLSTANHIPIDQSGHFSLSSLASDPSPSCPCIGRTEKVPLMRGTFLAAAAGMQPGLNCTAGRLSNQNRACTVGWGQQQAAAMTMASMQRSEAYSCT